MFIAIGTDPYCIVTAIILQHSGNIRWFGCAHWATQRCTILMTTSHLTSFVELMILYTMKYCCNNNCYFSREIERGTLFFAQDNTYHGRRYLFFG